MRKQAWENVTMKSLSRSDRWEAHKKEGRKNPYIIVIKRIIYQSNNKDKRCLLGVCTSNVEVVSKP